MKSKTGGKLAVHYNGDLLNAELLFRTLTSVNQLSVYGATAHWCGELALQIFDHAFFSTGTALAQVNEQLDCRLPPEVLSVKTTPLGIDVPAQGNLLRGHSERFENLPEDTRVIQMSNTAGYMRKISPRHFVTIRDLDDGCFRRCWSMSRIHTRDDEESVPVGWIRGHTKIGPLRGVKVTYHVEKYGTVL